MDTHTSAGPLPDVLIVGAMKSGSTSLHSLLSQHPALHFPEPKEPAFFSRESRFSLGLGKYREHFAKARPGQLGGESSTCYSRHPHYGDVPKRIFDSIPEVRLVYLMRHPIERMYSHYRHRMIERFFDDTGPVLNFEEALDQSDEFRDASLYAKQIEQYLKCFPLGRMLLLTTDELNDDPAATAMRVHRFLGVEPIAPQSLDLQNSFDYHFTHSGGRSEYDRLRKTRGAELVANLVPKPIRGLIRSIGRALARRFAQSVRTAEFETKLGPLTLSTRKRLLDEFARPNARLEEPLGQPVPVTGKS